jgi:hypothetical protein
MKIAVLQEELSHFEPQDRYNCDETGVYFKAIPEASLSSKVIAGKKIKKDRITAMLACNSDGSHKTRIWYIGKANQPYCFRVAKAQVTRLDMVWRSNKKAWMNTEIMIDWLRDFDKQMAGRKVVLTMDNFSAHAAAYDIIQKSDKPLRNTKVLFFPPNVTSKHQPLDQGIIAAWKANYKREWLYYMLKEVEAGRDPIITMDVLKCIRWGIRAWRLDVTSKTIKNCRTKAGLEVAQTAAVDSTAAVDADTPINEVLALLNRCKEQGIISEVPTIADFISPADEVVEDDLDDIEGDILETLAPEDDEEVPLEVLNAPPPRIISWKEAIDTVQLLHSYESQSKDPDGDFLMLIDRQERVISQRKASESKQSVISDFFKPKA